MGFDLNALTLQGVIANHQGSYVLSSQLSGDKVFRCFLESERIFSADLGAPDLGQYKHALIQGTLSGGASDGLPVMRVFYLQAVPCPCPDQALNQFACSAKLGDEPELRQTHSGLNVCNVRVGLRVGREEWFNFRAVFWRQQAENVAQYCHKGSRLGLKGQMMLNSWTTKEGQQRYDPELLVSDFAFLDSRPSNQPPARTARQQTAYGKPAGKPQATTWDTTIPQVDEIPF